MTTHQSSDRDNARERAARRASWPVAKYSLGNEPGENLTQSTTASERLAMMWELTVQAWLLSGRRMPDYDRASIPGKVIRRAR